MIILCMGFLEEVSSDTDFQGEKRDVNFNAWQRACKKAKNEMNSRYAQLAKRVLLMWKKDGEIGGIWVRRLSGNI